MTKQRSAKPASEPKTDEPIEVGSTISVDQFNHLLAQYKTACATIGELHLAVSQLTAENIALKSQVKK